MSEGFSFGLGGGSGRGRGRGRKRKRPSAVSVDCSNETVTSKAQKVLGGTFGVEGSIADEEDGSVSNTRGGPLTSKVVDVIKTEDVARLSQVKERRAIPVYH